MPGWLGQLFGAGEQRTSRHGPEARSAVRRQGADVLAALPSLVAGQRDYLPADAGSAASFAAALEPLARCVMAVSMLVAAMVLLRSPCQQAS